MYAEYKKKPLSSFPTTFLFWSVTTAAAWTTSADFFHDSFELIVNALFFQCIFICLFRFLMGGTMKQQKKLLQSIATRLKRPGDADHAAGETDQLKGMNMRKSAGADTGGVQVGRFLTSYCRRSCRKFKF